MNYYKEIVNMENFKKKVKNVVKNNFKISVDKYFEFENRYNFFYNLAVYLGELLEINKNNNVLDVGCGYGVSCKALIDKFKCNVKGIDLSEDMISFGKKLYPNMELLTGDGEKLEDYFPEEKFDKIVYNAAVFIFPDTLNAFKSAKNILTENGIIGFSHYPVIINLNGESLISVAYKRAGLEHPKKTVISDLDTCVENLRKSGFGNIIINEYVINFNVDFIKAFFSIPAQSASLFPKVPYNERIKLVESLFESIKNEKGFIKWPVVKGVCK
jgi:ubiquinone/menaquinone biosynthesis C-methylase UbiE